MPQACLELQLEISETQFYGENAGKVFFFFPDDFEHHICAGAKHSSLLKLTEGLLQSRVHFDLHSSQEQCPSRCFSDFLTLT